MASWTILGAGSWGTALALVLARNGHDVLLWDHRPERAAQMAVQRENRRYLPGVPLPENLQVSGDLQLALQPERQLLVAVPSHAFRGMLERMRPLLAPGRPLRSEEHTSELQSREKLVCRLLLEKKTISATS